MRPAACPHASAIADLVEGRMSPANVADVERHLDDCAACADLVAAAASEGSADATDVEANDAEPALRPGARLGRYEVLRFIGRGGMGTVYEGFDPQLDRKVALKLLRTPRGDQPRVHDRLVREARTMAKLSSAHVVSALDFGVHQDRVFLVMELVDGTNLATWLRASARTWREILQAFLAAGEGLAAAHDVGIVHRDFKPQNVMMGADGRVRVTDFGLARSVALTAGASAAGARAPDPKAAADGGAGDSNLHLAAAAATSGGGVATRADSSHTRRLSVTGLQLGTPRYMAPEQFLGNVSDARADQFSFCVALYEALCGRHPLMEVDGQTIVESPKDAAIGPRSLPPSRIKGVPRTVTAALTRGLARTPAARFSSMHQLLGALRAPLVAATKRRRRWLRAAALVGFVAIVTGASIARLKDRSAESRPLTLTGTAADWSGAPILARFDAFVHCVIPMDDNTLRVVWGNPHKAEDIDLRTKLRRPSDLVPESYRYGCPQLSPDRRQLLFEGYDTDGRAHIFHSDDPSGKDARPVVNSAETTLGSEPLWLSSNKEFVFDLDYRNPAVFSLQTNSLTVISNAKRGNGDNFDKAVAPVNDRILIFEQTLFHRSGLWLYQWPNLTTAELFTIGPNIFGNWRMDSIGSAAYGPTDEAGMYGIAVLDFSKPELRRLGQLPNRCIYGALEIGHQLALWSRRPSSQLWARTSDGSARLIASRECRDPAMLADGTVIAHCMDPEGLGTFAYSPGQTKSRKLSAESQAGEVSALPDGGWVARLGPDTPGIFRCPGVGQPCHMILSDGSILTLAASPDGKTVAFLSLRPNGVQVRTVSIDGTGARDLVARATACPPVWSGPSTLWVSQRGAEGVVWSEFDVVSGARTGKTAPGHGDCINWDPDPDPPVHPRAWRTVADDWNIQLVPNPGL